MRRPYSRLAAACALAAATAACASSAFAGNANGNANAPGQQKQDEAAAQQQPQAPAQEQAPSQQSEASQPAEHAAPGQAKKEETAQAQQSPPPGQAKKSESSSTASIQAGVKPSSTTSHWTHCITGGTAGVAVGATCKAVAPTPDVGADVSKRYGNGKTAAQIAVARGGLGVKLTGPGNSQPHKVSDCRHKNNHSGGVDVHAIKSYSTSCQEQAAAQQTVTAVASCGHGQETMARSCGSQTAVQSSPVQQTASSQGIVQVAPALPTVTPPVASVQATPAPAVQAAPPASAAATPASGTGNVLGAQTTLGKPTAKGGVLGTAANVAGTSLPFTGFPVWIAVALALGLIGGGVALRRRGLAA
jgi:hypothetical protein